MNTTYEKSSDTSLAVITTTRQILPISDLQSQRADKVSQLVRINSSHDLEVQSLETDIAAIDAKLAKAMELGITV